MEDVRRRVVRATKVNGPVGVSVHKYNGRRYVMWGDEHVDSTTKCDCKDPEICVDIEDWLEYIMSDNFCTDLFIETSFLVKSTFQPCCCNNSSTLCREL